MVSRKQFDATENDLEEKIYHWEQMIAATKTEAAALAENVRNATDEKYLANLQKSLREYERKKTKAIKQLADYKVEKEQLALAASKPSPTPAAQPSIPTPPPPAPKPLSTPSPMPTPTMPQPARITPQSTHPQHSSSAASQMRQSKKNRPKVSRLGWLVSVTIILCATVLGWTWGSNPYTKSRLHTLIMGQPGPAFTGNYWHYAFPDSSEITAVTLNHNGTYAAAGYEDGAVRILDLKTGILTFALRLKSPVLSLVFSEAPTDALTFVAAGSAPSNEFQVINDFYTSTTSYTSYSTVRPEMLSLYGRTLVVGNEETAMAFFLKPSAVTPLYSCDPNSQILSLTHLQDAYGLLGLANGSKGYCHWSTGTYQEQPSELQTIKNFETISLSADVMYVVANLGQSTYNLHNATQPINIQDLNTSEIVDVAFIAKPLVSASLHTDHELVLWNFATNVTEKQTVFKAVDTDLAQAIFEIYDPNPTAETGGKFVVLLTRDGNLYIEPLPDFSVLK